MFKLHFRKYQFEGYGKTWYYLEAALNIAIKIEAL
jgi:hypothetical protein